MKTFEFIDASFLKIAHKHVLPEDNNFGKGSFEATVVEVDTSDWVWTFDLLNLLALSIGILDLLFELGNIHPIVVYHILDESLFPFVQPEERRVGPSIFCAVLGHFAAHLVQIINDLRRILLDVSVITDLEVKVPLNRFDFFLLYSFAVGVFLPFHPHQQFLSFLFVDIVHFVLNFTKATDYIIDGTDNLSDSL